MSAIDLTLETNVDIVNQISTSILALNASIEAARAGEASPYHDPAKLFGNSQGFYFLNAFAKKLMSLA